MSEACSPMISGRHSQQKETARLSHSGAWVEARRRIPAAFLWIILLALGLRAIARLRFDAVAFDSALYFEMANFFLAGRWPEALAFPYPPLYPLLIAGIQRFAVSAETAGLLIAVLADLLLFFPLVAVARIAVGETGAWAAAFLWAIHPLAIRLGVQALTDAPTAFFVAMALWAGLRALDESRPVWAVGAGAASGLAYLLRPEGIEPALALSALCLFSGNSLPQREGEAPGSRQRFGSKPLAAGKRTLRRAAWVAAPLVGWAIVALPYVAYISRDAGSLTLSKKKSASAILRSLALPRGRPEEGARPEGATGSPAGALPFGGKTADQPIRGGRATSPSWLPQFAKSTYIFQKPLVNGMNPVVLILGLLGVWRNQVLKTEGSRRARAVLLGLLVLHLTVLLGLAAMHGATYLGGHHFFLLVLYALPFAGAGLAWLLTRWASRRSSARWIPAVALILVVAGTVIWVVNRRADQGVMVRPAAAWIRAQVVGTPVVVTNLAKLTYHARAERVDLNGAYDDILRRGRAQSAQFVAFYPDLVPQSSHDFLARLNPTDLELVKTFPEPSPSAPEQRLEIYRFRPRR